MSAKIVAQSLSRVLADSYVLMLKTQNYHWNVVGPYFHSLHQLFGLQYDELFVSIDEIAERIRQLGERAPGTMKEFLALTQIREEGAESAATMVADLAACHDLLVKSVQSCLEIASKQMDDVTTDLMVRRSSAHHKAGWMLRSTLGDEPSRSNQDVARESPKAKKVSKEAKPKSKSKSKPVVKVSAPKVVAASVSSKAKKPAKVSPKPSKVVKPKASKPMANNKKKAPVALG